MAIILNILYTLFPKVNTGHLLIDTAADTLANKITEPLTTSVLISVMVAFLLIIITGIFLFHKYFNKKIPTTDFSKLYKKLDIFSREISEISKTLQSLESLKLIKDKLEDIIILKDKLDTINTIVSKNRDELLEIRLNSLNAKDNILRLENNYKDMQFKLFEINTILKSLLDAMT